MTSLEYLETLNEKMKEKLIWLCLNKKIMESMDSYDETNYDETEDLDKEEELEAI